MTSIIKHLKSYRLLRRIASKCTPLHWISPARRNMEQQFRDRIAVVLTCPDNALIERVCDAGQVYGSLQTMHNGIQVLAGGYYGDWMTDLLWLNRGVHEPQEERAFTEVLRHLPDSATIIEGGAYWAFYSIWFARTVKQPRCILVEPDATNLKVGLRNFAINNLAAESVCAAIGSVTSRSSGVQTTTVDRLRIDLSIGLIDILHLDVQGAEVDALLGSVKAFEANAIRYVFVSTHSDKLHAECVAFLHRFGFTIIAEADLSDTFSYDGLIVGKASWAEEPATIPVSRRTCMSPH